MISDMFEPPAIEETPEEVVPEVAAPELDRLQLNGREIELEADKAAEIRDAFAALSASYAQNLEQQKRSFESMGRPEWKAPDPQPAIETSGFELPDPDLMFSNKDLWKGGFESSLEARLAREKTERIEMAQGLATAFQKELTQREQAARTKANHDHAWETMLQRRGLSEYRDVADLVYSRTCNDPRLANLPFDQAFDHMGVMVEQRVAAIRGQAETAEAPAEAAVPERAAAPAPPVMLRSGRKAGGQAAPVKAESNQGALARAILKVQAAHGF